MRTYRVRSHRGKGSDYHAAVLTVPSELARVLPDEIEFTVELVEDGILYRRVEAADKPLPSWAAPKGES